MIREKETVRERVREIEKERVRERKEAEFTAIEIGRKRVR